MLGCLLPTFAHDPSLDGRECRAPFVCADRVDELGNDCKCDRAVGRNNCAVCQYSTLGTSCLRCTNSKYLRLGACVDECRDGDEAVGTGADGLRCL